MSAERLGYYEFFAGGGMARLGLGARWRCLMANDFCAKKARSYRENFPPAGEFIQGDVAALRTADLPGRATLAWASFPCQDLSLAGLRGGLKGKRSGTFWPFWELMRGLGAEGRGAPLIVLENVVGAVTSNRGADFRALVAALADEGYRVGALTIDAAHFVPQSRPRLFIVAVRREWAIPETLLQEGPAAPWHSAALKAAHGALPRRRKAQWVWWRLPAPEGARGDLTDLIDEDGAWRGKEETARLLAMMAPAHLEKVRQAQALRRRVVGTVFRRTRTDAEGRKVQRAEVRFDQVGGCLRTPAGGSSRQIILEVKGKRVRSRLLSAREAARLMGAPESYRLPERANEAYHLLGDGLAPPVVAHLEQSLLWPLARANGED